MRPYFFLILIATFGCPLLAQETAADLVLLNADVRTMDPARPSAQAVAVAGNRIIAVGGNSEVQKLIGPATRVIDARGRMVLPGFNDAHVHFMAIGNTFSSLDARGIAEPAKLYDELRRHSRYLPAGRWIIASGAAAELLNRLDAATVESATPRNPVLIFGAASGMAFADAAAAESAKYGRERAGVITGSTLEIVRRAVPPDHSRNWAEIAETATNYAASLGVTSVTDTHSDDMAAVYRELERAGKLKTRVYDCLSLPEQVKAKAAAPRLAPDEMVRTGCLKGFTEGEDDWTPTLAADAVAADKLGWQIAIHAIGERANGAAAEVLAAVERANGRRDRRFRVEHAERANAETVRRFGLSGAVASIQPFLFGSSRRGYYSSLTEAGARLALGSDAPMTSFDPILGIQAAVAGGVSVEEAFRGYTAGAAFAEFAEEQKGALIPGKLADLIILSDNIMYAGGPADIARSSVTLTVVNGNVVYEAR